MTTATSLFQREDKNGNMWLALNEPVLASTTDHGIEPIVLPSEADVGEAMFKELLSTAEAKTGDINIALLCLVGVVPSNCTACSVRKPLPTKLMDC